MIALQQPRGGLAEPRGSLAVTAAVAVEEVAEVAVEAVIAVAVFQALFDKTKCAISIPAGKQQRLKE